MKHTLHLPPAPKSPEQILNRHEFLKKRKLAVAATASHFKSGREDKALALQLLLLDVRQRELLWCLSKTPTTNA